MACIFISYRRTEPDSSVANDVYQALANEGHEVFLDVKLPVGTAWAERIEEALSQTDVLVTLLSEQSVRSEMVIGEIGTAHRLKKRILPVRLAYREPFQYPLSAWLDPINWAFWDGPASTSRLLGELKRAIAGEAVFRGEGSPRDALAQAPVPDTLRPPSPLAPIELETGTMDVESRFYIPRKADEIALATIARKGQTLSIKGARQMGKSSLLMRILGTALKAGKRVAFVDCQGLDSPTLADANLFFRKLCVEISDQLELKSQVDAYWTSELGNVQRCSKYMGDYILKSINAPLVLAFDEVDRLYDAPFRSDFLGMLRSWHSKRALPTTAVWKQFDLVLVTSTEPNLLIDNLNQSPFNVGERLELSDFTPEEVSRLNQLHGPALKPEDEQRLWALVGGHPYLVRRALYLVASRQLSADELLNQADFEGSAFGDHLRHLLFLLNKRQSLQDGLREVLLQRKCSDAAVRHRLRSAGLIRSDGDRVEPRCDLYTRYFRKHLVD